MASNRISILRISYYDADVCLSGLSCNVEISFKIGNSSDGYTALGLFNLVVCSEAQVHRLEFSLEAHKGRMAPPKCMFYLEKVQTAFHFGVAGRP